TTQAENPVLSVLFSADGRSIAPDGGSQGALFHLIHTSADPDLEENYTSIRVFGATGRVRVYPGERR
ncbi:hypothetical protein HQ520_15800, partial [bacterium]|nr:hypothetical protein [bacterium]